eukprot:TRINITY_DN4054_c0_g1_i1.p1 TRINITY_DN4054_c0_g1~~TRINITY_DN4054_c0_g1_i1.p1  ORF type:complete len:254 (-),score=21.85 TRINITY_DN4054_c0_g1_i1:331-1092(-)
MENIPAKYLCPRSQKIMLNPVVEIKTGNIYDKRSILDQSDQLLDLDFYPLDGLKHAIHLYLHQNIQSVELREELLRQDEEWQDISDSQSSTYEQGMHVQGSRRAKALHKYEYLAEKTRDKNTETSQLFSNLKDAGKEYQTDSIEYQKRFAEFISVNKEFENITYQNTYEKIFDQRQNSFVACKALVEQINQCYQSSYSLSNSRKQYERSLQQLLNMEGQMKSAREELKNAHADIGLKMEFINEVDFYSEQFKF